MKIKTTQQLMSCIPFQNVNWDTHTETGLIRIIKPKFKSNWAKSLFNPFVKGENFIIKLDELGTEVWKNCNGKNTIEEIGIILGRKFGSDIEPIYDRLNKFTMQLLRSKFIRLECPENND